MSPDANDLAWSTAEACRSLAAALEAVDAGEINASDPQRAYIAGALHALEVLAGQEDPDDGSS